jgi:phosphoribosylamine--glycine ligase
MIVLLLGSGGREHALAWKITQSPLCDQLFIAPGNAGTAALGYNLKLDPNDFVAIRQAVYTHGIDMIICGPEEPLVRGLEDFFADDPAMADVHIIGPSQAAAQLEGSKAFAKAFMEEFGIPTASYRAFTTDTLAEGLAWLDQQPTPIVLKADGLAAGKGVLILDDRATAKEELTAMLEGKFGEASSRVVIESFLQGIEFSVFVLTDGSSYRLLPVAKDYKRVGEGDTGLNTGGMGSVSHPAFVDAALMEKVEQRIIAPTLAGLQARQLRYRGFIFFGLIAVDGEPYVIEYNCRLGDPETESVMPRLRSDLLELCLATAEGWLGETTIETDPRTAVTVMLVSGGYPGEYAKGKKIEGLGDLTDSMVFHAGTAEQEGEVITQGGRVLAVTSLADDLPTALAHSLRNAERIHYEGKYFRKDIGFDL